MINNSGCFFSRLFGFRMSALGSGIFDFRIDLATQQYRHTGDIKPEEQNDYRAQRSICFAIAVEEVEVHAEKQGSADPCENSHHRAGSDPLPLLLGVWAPVIQKGER